MGSHFYFFLGGWGQAGFVSFAKDPDDTNEEQLSHEEGFHDERT